MLKAGGRIMKQRWVFLIVFVGLYFCVTSFAQAQDEEIPLTTYYPAPHGDYKSLDTETIQITGGTPAAGKVLTSDDSNGNASWQDVSAGTFGVQVAVAVGAPYVTTSDGFITVSISGSKVYSYCNIHITGNTVFDADLGQREDFNEPTTAYIATIPVKSGSTITITKPTAPAGYTNLCTVVSTWTPLQ